MPDPPKQHVSLASFIFKVNTFVSSCRQVYDASRRLDTDLAKLSADELQSLKDAATQVVNLANFFNSPPGEWPFENVGKNGKKIIDGWPKNPTKPTDFDAALQAMRDLFDPGKENTITDVGEGTVGSGGGGTVVTSPPPPGDGIGLHELFANVSNSLLTAQKELNRNSLEYVANLDPNIPPAYYGIPSVKAEMHVGFSQMKQQGINLILFSSMQQKQQFAESTVTFEVVGAPPPPGPTRFGEFVVPIPRLFIVGAKRDEVLNKVWEKLDAKRFANGRDAAVVLRYEESQTPPASPPKPKMPPRYFVIWPGFNGNTSLSGWLILAAARVVEKEDANGKVEYDLDPSAFNPPQEVFKITKPEAPNLGEVVVGLISIVGSWIEAMKYKPPPR